MEPMETESLDEKMSSTESVEKENSELESEDEMSDPNDFNDEDEDEKEVKNLESLLELNPYDYQSHVALISKLQSMGELEKLRVARQNMSSKYPLTPELWLAWLRDEMKLAVTPEERKSITQLYERAVQDYLSVELWLEYLQFSIGSMDDNPESVRSLFERALTSAGLHVTKGAIIWEAYREFENVLVSMTTNDTEKKQQIDRVGNLFRRQLACPLLDMEKTLVEFETWRSEEGAVSSVDEKTIKASYQRALSDLTARLPFEDKIVVHDNTADLYDHYKAYLHFETINGDPGRTTVLFERAITDLSLESRLWMDYVLYVESTIKLESVLVPIYVRAVKNVPWCSKIWHKWMRSTEKWGKPILDVQAILENALSAGLSTADDYRMLWLDFLECLRRQMDTSDDKQREKQLETLRETFNRACEHLAKIFGLDGDPQCVILQFWARTEAIHAGDMEKARALWTDILSQGHSASAASWLEYISLERCYGDTKHLRKLFPRALAAVKDWPESIANAWLDFVRDEGTLEEMEVCETKSTERLEKIVAEREKLQEPAKKQDTSAGPTGKKANKRKAEEDGKWKTLAGASSSKQIKIDKDTTTSPVAKTENKEEKPAENEVSPQVDESITVFISNLDYTATEDEVRKALEPAGPITLFKMVRDYKGRSKGFCYVQLISPATVSKALKLDRTPINGRPMYVSRCDPNKTTRGTVFKYSSSLEKNKLFVKGLPLTTTKEHLETLFKVHGPLKDVRIVTYRNGHSKGLAYVEFEDECSASKAVLATDGMALEDKVISVAISKPPERKVNVDEQIKSLGGSNVSRSHFGMPRTMLSMIPRSVAKSAGAPAKNGNSTIDHVEPMSNQSFRDLLINKK